MCCRLSLDGQILEFFEQPLILQGRFFKMNFTEILYADDTICVSCNAEAMQEQLLAIEYHGAKYGMHLNKKKCEVMTNSKANVHSADCSKVLQKEEVKYLGCEINQATDYKRELGKRMAIATATLKKLDTFMSGRDGLM